MNTVIVLHHVADMDFEEQVIDPPCVCPLCSNLHRCLSNLSSLLLQPHAISSLNFLLSYSFGLGFISRICYICNEIIVLFKYKISFWKNSTKNYTITNRI